VGFLARFRSKTAGISRAVAGRLISNAVGGEFRVSDGAARELVLLLEEMASAIAARAIEFAIYRGAKTVSRDDILAAAAVERN